MIAAQRRAHLIVWIVLVPVLLAAIVVGVVSRKPRAVERGAAQARPSEPAADAPTDAIAPDANDASSDASRKEPSR